MVYIRILIGLIYLSSIVHCQLLGSCPVIPTGLNLDIDRFLGVWYEVERTPSVTGSLYRCVSSDYQRRADGSIWVNNSMISELTNIKQSNSGKVTFIPNSSRYTVRYTILVINYDVPMNVLNIDYWSYAIITSCNQIDPVGYSVSTHVMTRQRHPSDSVLLKAYAALERYGYDPDDFISTDQDDCDGEDEGLFDRVWPRP